MIGTFTYRKGGRPGLWVVDYKGPSDEARSALCYVQKDEEGKWVVPLIGRTLGPFKDRWHAAHAFLKHELLDPQSETIEQEVAAAWELSLNPRPDLMLTSAQAEAIYKLLVAKCMAPKGDRRSFVYAHSDPRVTSVCSSWRFCGIFGFGGKFYNTSHRWYVSAYPEDTHAEERLILAETNAQLQKMYLEAFRSE